MRTFVFGTEDKMPYKVGQFATRFITEKTMDGNYVYLGRVWEVGLGGVLQTSWGAARDLDPYERNGMTQYTADMIGGVSIVSTIYDDRARMEDAARVAMQDKGIVSPEMLDMWFPVVAMIAGHKLVFHAQEREDSRGIAAAIFRFDGAKLVAVYYPLYSLTPQTAMDHLVWDGEFWCCEAITGRKLFRIDRIEAAAVP